MHPVRTSRHKLPRRPCRARGLARPDGARDAVHIGPIRGSGQAGYGGGAGWRPTPVTGHRGGGTCSIRAMARWLAVVVSGCPAGSLALLVCRVAQPTTAGVQQGRSLTNSRRSRAGDRRRSTRTPQSNQRAGDHLVETGQQQEPLPQPRPRSYPIAATMTPQISDIAITASRLMGRDSTPFPSASEIRSVRLRRRIGAARAFGPLSYRWLANGPGRLASSTRRCRHARG